MQERHNSIANARELRLSCTNPSMWYMYQSIHFVIIGSSKGLLLVHDKAITWIWDDLSIWIPGTKLESNLNDFFFQEISFENPSFTMWTNFIQGCMYWTFSHYCILLFTLGCHSIALMMFYTEFMHSHSRNKIEFLICQISAILSWGQWGKLYPYMIYLVAVKYSWGLK